MLNPFFIYKIIRLFKTGDESSAILYGEKI